MRMHSTVFCTALLMLSPAAVAQNAAPPAPVPISAFIEGNSFSDPRLSPDGRHLAVKLRVPSASSTALAVLVYAMPGMQLKNSIRLPDDNIPISFAWTSNTRLVIQPGVEQGTLSPMLNYGELLATDIDGKRQVYLHGAQRPKKISQGGRYPDDDATGQVEGIDPAYKDRLFISSQIWKADRTLLYDVDARNGERTLVAELPMPMLDFLNQHDGKPRLAFGTDAQDRPVVFRRNDGTGAWDKRTGLGRTYTPLAFSADDRSVAVLHSASGEPEALIVEDLQSGERKSVHADPEGSALPLGSPLGGLPYAAYAPIGIPRPVYLNDGADARLVQLLSKQFPDGHVDVESASLDGRLVLFSVRSDRDAGTYYLFDRQTNGARLLFASKAELDPKQMAERRPVKFKARDGLTIHGFLTLPRRADGAPPPLVLMPHSGPFPDRDQWYFDTDAQFLASRGYAVLQLNFRGSSGRGPAFREAGLREWHGKIPDDLLDGVRWVIGQKQVDARRICVYGASFGAYLAMMVAAREPELFKCAVGYAGVYDLKRLRQTKFELDAPLAATFDKEVGKEISEQPLYSPVGQARKIKAAVLLVHGGRDKRAGIEHANDMRAALSDAGRPPEWFVAPDEGHGFFGTRNLSAFYQRLEAFLARHLGK